LTAASSFSKNNFLANLTHLDLADNTFGTADGGGKLLSKAISTMTSLTFLDLRDCSMEDEGIANVCDALYASKASLSHFDVSGNEVTGDQGSSSLKKLFLFWGKKKKHSLTYFGAEENELGNSGMKKIMLGLSSCSAETLKVLKMNTNEIGDAGIAGLLNGNFTKIEKLLIDGNEFSATTLATLEEKWGDKIESLEDNDDEGEGGEDEDEDEDEEDEASEYGSEDEETDDLNDAINKIAL